MLAWKEIERDLEEAKQQQQMWKKGRNGGAAAAAGAGKDDSWWQGRLRALRERDWTMFNELERLKGEWARLNRVERERRVPGARTTL